jgi:prephenate dehydratase
VASNALAARLVKDEPNAAAIASEVALGLYGLERVAKNIEDKTGNVTQTSVVLLDNDFLTSVGIVQVLADVRKLPQYP